MSSYGSLAPIRCRPPQCAPLLAALAAIEIDARDALVRSARSSASLTWWPPSESELLLRWQFESGRVVVTTTAKRDRLSEYLAALAPEDEETVERVPRDASARISKAGEAGGLFRSYWAKEFGEAAE